MSGTAVTDRPGARSGRSGSFTRNALSLFAVSTLDPLGRREQIFEHVGDGLEQLGQHQKQRLDLSLDVAAQLSPQKPQRLRLQLERVELHYASDPAAQFWGHSARPQTSVRTPGRSACSATCVAGPGRTYRCELASPAGSTAPNARPSVGPSNHCALSTCGP